MSKKELKARIEALEARVAMLEAQAFPSVATNASAPSWAEITTYGEPLGERKFQNTETGEIRTVVHKEWTGNGFVPAHSDHFPAELFQ